MVSQIHGKYHESGTMEGFALIFKDMAYANSLACKRPDLAAQWHPVKNGGLTPEDVMPGSGKKVWWYLPYDDPDTGKHFDFEWECTVFKRAIKGYACPYLSGQAVWNGFNDLAAKYPDIAKQWHPVKNGSLKPEDVTWSSGKKVWWLLPYDDPETGKHFDFEWEARISNRVSGHDCPYFSGQAVWKGFNDLATKRPDLAKQWHPVRNGDLTPEDVTCGSGKKVWWRLPYDDHVSGAHIVFEWDAVIVNRTAGGAGCPYLLGCTVLEGLDG